jgi:hypothetical protein
MEKMGKWTDRYMARQADRQTNRYTDRQTCIPIYRLKDRQREDRQTIKSKANLKDRSILIRKSMDKLKLTGRNLGQVFNSRAGCMCVNTLAV